MSVEPEFGYARAPDGAYIAYSTFGEGPPDLVWQLDWVGNVDITWDWPVARALFGGLATFSRVILHDRRGTGLSSRNVPVPDLETRVADLGCVLAAVGADRVALAGAREGGAPNVLLAASKPEQVRSLIWLVPQPRSTWAHDYPWGVGPEYVARDAKALESWGTDRYADAFAAAEAAGDHDVGQLNDHDRRTVARLTRHTATPDVVAELSRVWYETDIRTVMPAVRVPSLLLVYEDDEVDRQTTEYAASLIPGSEIAFLPGNESANDVEPLVDAIRSFLGVETRPSADRVLATIMFTDIVDSTSSQAALGDRAWKDLIERHHALIRMLLRDHGGTEQDTAGDGFYARFDGPARAIRCACEAIERVQALGIRIRAGVHTGECEITDGKCAGLAVSIGARVTSEAEPSEVLVSQTVKDLVAGSGLAFEDAGEHELKGVPDRWRLYRVMS